MRLFSPMRRLQRLDDSVVHGRALNGDVDAFSELYRRYRDPVLRRIRSLLPPFAEIEDAVQDTFLEFYRCMHRYDGRRPLEPWLVSIARNVALRHRRKGASRTLANLDHLDLKGEEWSRLVARDQIRALHGLLDELPEAQQEAFLLHTVEGLTLAQVADAVGAPINTVVTRVRRARMKLIERMNRLERPRLREVLS